MALKFYRLYKIDRDYDIAEKDSFENLANIERNPIIGQNHSFKLRKEKQIMRKLKTYLNYANLSFLN